MNKSEIFLLINQNPTFCLGTLENMQPHVRIITLFRADENGIIFATGKHKEVYQQIISNPHVELHFWIADKGTQVRISGIAIPVEDKGIKESVVEKFTFLKPWVEKEGYDQLAPFTLENARALVWTRDVEFMPKDYIDL